jgi:NADH:ubiquinone reductase (non-electrogenic)
MYTVSISIIIILFSYYFLSLTTACYCIQEVADARLIRNRILTNFELATQQATSEEERKRLLHFVIVGGGPTGVEFGAEFYDFLMQVWH